MERLQINGYTYLIPPEVYALVDGLKRENARLRDERDCARIEAATAKAIGDPRC